MKPDCVQTAEPDQQPVADDASQGADAATRAFFADLVLRHAADGVVVTDERRRTLWVNEAFSALTGYTLADLRGRDPGSVLQGADTNPATIQRITDACRHRQEIRCDILNYTAGGVPYWVDLHVCPVHDSAGRHTHFITTLRDITERRTLEDQNEAMRQVETMRQAERQLLAQTSEWLYSARSYDELMMVLRRAMHTLIPEADGALYIYSDARKSLELAAGWGSDPAFSQRIGTDDCWSLRRGRAYSYGLKAIEFPCSHARAGYTPGFCLPIIAHGETMGLLHFSFEGFEDGALLRPMREQVLRNRWEIALICAEQISLAIANVRLRQELHDQSVRDPLTGLWNRRWFIDAAGRELAHATDTGTALALISFDVDHFKRFNDQYGHDAGDLVLQEVGALLRLHFFDRHHPCRLGGEEFLVLCNDTAIDDAVALARDFTAALRDMVVTRGGTPLPQVTVSAGVAGFPDHGRSVESLMKSADLALYSAKDQGRDRVVSAPPDRAGAVRSHRAGDCGQGGDALFAGTVK